MIAILVHNPDYAAAPELVKAFSLLGQTDLISFQRGHPMFQRDPGHLIDDAEGCRAIIENANMLVFGDASSFRTLAALYAQNKWRDVLEAKRKIALLGDTEYINNPDKFGRLCVDYSISLFTMPGYRPLNMNTIPFHHPFEYSGPVEKRMDAVVVMHSPAQQNKANQKGTRQITDTAKDLEKKHSFIYRREMGLSYGECIRRKSEALVFIDQFTPEAQLPCLGRNGCEALALGCVTLSSIYDPEMVDGYFDMPPVVGLVNLAQMEMELEQLVMCSTQQLVDMGQCGREWAKKTIAYQPFIEYVTRYA